MSSRTTYAKRLGQGVVRAVLMLVIWPMMVVLLVFVLLPLTGVLLLASETWDIVSGIHFGGQMRRRGRFLPWPETLRRIEAEGGTLLIEAPTIGCRIRRAWWTPDDLPALSPYPPSTEEEYRAAVPTMISPPWDRWCWEEYLSPETGRAWLVRGWNGKSVERRFHKRFPTLPIIRVWTGIVNAPPLPHAVQDDLPET